MTTRELHWSWRDRDVVLGLDETGAGPLVVLLPTLSSISTRGEMYPLMERLAPQFRVVSIDWPGFGTLPRPSISWMPDALSAFLDHALQAIGTRPYGVLAAGHAATYVLHHAVHHPDTIDRLALIAPTWREPLPTMAGGHRPLFDRIRRAVEALGIGQLLYRLNVNAFVIRKMAAGHVYSETPRKSLAEMEALAALPRIRAERLAKGKLSVHEEFPDDVAAAVRRFLLS